jgi:hypothetical protein
VAREFTLGRILYMLDDPADIYCFSLFWHHCGDSRHCAGVEGMPDLFVAGPGGELWAEVKEHPGQKLRPGQSGWRYRLLASGHQYVIWTAASLADGTVRNYLGALL